eukprot:scaffold82942_cov47-Phaeocystis_antarctica.AAC.1
MMTHKVKRLVQRQPQTETDGSVSLPDSLPARRRSLAKAPTASLPPGPPSSRSSTGQSVAEQEVMPPPWAVPATWAGWRSSAANSGVASAPLAPPKRPAPPESASAPRAKRAFKTDSPPLSLPPAAPSSTDSGLSSTASAPDRQWLGIGDARNNDVALTAPASGLEETSEPTEAELAAFMADEEAALEMVLELQDILASPPARASPEVVAGVTVAQQRTTTAAPTAPPVASPPDLARLPSDLARMFEEPTGLGAAPAAPAAPPAPSMAPIAVAVPVAKPAGFRWAASLADLW